MKENPMFRAISITPGEFEDETAWIHLSNPGLSDLLDQRLGAGHRTHTLTAQTPRTPELVLVTAADDDGGTGPANLLATAVAKAFGRDWDVHGEAIILACESSAFINLTDEIWSWVIDVHSGLVAAPFELKEASSITPVLAGIHVERMRQLAKWGEQRREDGTGGPVMHRRAEEARACCDYLAKHGGADWRAFLLAHAHEAMAETDPVKLRAGLVTTAATCVAWIEDLDTRTVGG